jgi:hypothetical protein
MEEYNMGNKIKIDLIENSDLETIHLPGSKAL